MTGKTKHLVIYCSVFGTLLTMGFMILFSTRSFALVSAIAVFLFALYGLGLSIVQGLPLTPNFKLTTIDRRVVETGGGGGCTYPLNDSTSYRTNCGFRNKSDID